MKSPLISFTVLALSVSMHASALTISEIMSNPIGDDGGREWIELYNETESGVDISGLTIVIKGGSPIAVTSVSGATTIPSHGYVVVSSLVSGASKFLQDYPAYAGPLFKSAISLVNTGVTSLEVRLQGVTVDTLSSYTAAKEGSSYSKINGQFVVAAPSPGEDNKNTVIHPNTQQQEESTTTATVGTQSTLPQASAPSADIVLYLPFEKTVVAGAPTLFSVTSMTRAGKAIDGMSYAWSFGDGGQGKGSTTTYRYFYPGRYVASVEGANGFISGTGRINVRVVSPDIAIVGVGTGKYGPYVDISNPSTYDLDISDWKLAFDGVPFPFPKNTLIKSGVTRFSGAAMGFASTTLASTTLLTVIFPNLEELLRVQVGSFADHANSTSSVSLFLNKPSTTGQNSLLKKSGQVTDYAVSKKMVHENSKIAKQGVATSSQVVIRELGQKKDTRIATFLRSLFR